MKGNGNIHFRSLSSEWATDQHTFETENRRIGGFDLDASATQYNTKCKKYINPIQDSLLVPWDGKRIWLNPPYGRSVNIIKLNKFHPEIVAKFTNDNGVFDKKVFRECCPELYRDYVSDMEDWIGKAWLSSKHAQVVCLVASRTDTLWFHKYCYDVDTGETRPGCKVRFVKGRLKFGGSKDSAPFPSMLIYFDRRDETPSTPKRVRRDK